MTAASNSKADFRIRAYDRFAASIVKSLRSLADEVERNARPYDKPGITGTPRYLAAAEQVNHALTWGIANLGAYRLFDTAHHADVAVAEAAGKDES